MDENSYSGNIFLGYDLEIEEKKKIFFEYNYQSILVLLRQLLENHLTFSYIYQLSNPLKDFKQLDKYKRGVKTLILCFQIYSKLNYDKFNSSTPFDLSWSQLNKNSLEQMKEDINTFKKTEFQFGRMKKQFSKFIEDPERYKWKEGNGWILSKLNFKDSIRSIYDFLSDYVHGNFFALEEISYLRFPNDVKFLRVLISSILVSKLLFFARLYLIITNNKIVFPVSKNDENPEEYFEMIRKYQNFEKSNAQLITDEHMKDISIEFV